jgi:hypothetical protein
VIYLKTKKKENNTYVKKDKNRVSKYMSYGAVIAVLFAAEGWLGPDIWLASTQWLLVALVLIAFGIYLKLN